MRETLHTQIALEALAMAIERQRPAPGLIHHSDSQWIEASSRAA
jgi:transposase InsO family protein